MALSASHIVYDSLLDTAKTGFSSTSTTANSVQAQVSAQLLAVSELTGKAKAYYAKVNGLNLDSAALTYRLAHASALSSQYSGVCACFTSAADKLYKDICRYFDEITGIARLYDQLISYATDGGNLHIAEDFSSHGTGIQFQPYYNAKNSMCGKCIGIFPLDSCVEIPVLAYNDTIVSGSTPTPAETISPTIIPVADGAVVELRLIYSADGDAYLQYPVVASSLLDSSQLVLRQDIAGSVSSWYNYDGSKSNYGGESAYLSIRFVKSALNPDTGPYYLVLNVGSLAPTSAGGTAHVVATARHTGTWSFESDCIVVADDYDETVRTDDTTLTMSYRWTTGNTDGSVIKLPIPVQATADLTSSSGTSYNAVTLTVSGTTSVPGIAYYLQK